MSCVHEIRFMEHLAVQSSLSLSELCSAVQEALDLPGFELDRENETEWGTSIKDGVKYNISRPYRSGTLRTWDSSVPVGFNIGLSLAFSDAALIAHPTSQQLVFATARKLAIVLGVVVYHRTWLAPGQNIVRNVRIEPGA